MPATQDVERKVKKLCVAPYYDIGGVVRGHCNLDEGHEGNHVSESEERRYEWAMTKNPKDGCQYFGVDRLKPAPAMVEEAVRILLRSVGENPDRDGLKETPKRVVKALAEMTAGYLEKPEEILSKCFDEPYDEVIVVRDIPFTSMCEHHMLPFIGTVDVGYLPGKVVGLSKIARLVDCFSRRLQIQERLTKEIQDAITKHLLAKGVAVVVKATHSCMSCRGVRKPGAEMVTSAMSGCFRDNSSARAEFLSLCK